MKRQNVKIVKWGGVIEKDQNRGNNITVDGRVHRLLEISRQIDTLRREQEQILQSLLLEAQPKLFFDDDRRRIYWNGGSVKLGKKSYLFVKTLWQGKHYWAELSELEVNVWMQDPESEQFVARRTISTLVQHTQKNLTEAQFPYKIESVKNLSLRELKGFHLVLADGQKKTCPLG